MTSDDQNVIKKRVSPYPFPIQLTQAEGGEVKTGRVVKLTQVGFLVEFPSFLPVVGSDYMVEFKLPTFEDQILVKVKVIKTYDSFRSGEAEPEAVPTAPATEKPVVAGPASKSIHLAEMHFLKQSLLQKQAILRWLMKIKQVK